MLIPSLELDGIACVAIDRGRRFAFRGRGAGRRHHRYGGPGSTPSRGSTFQAGHREPP